MKTIMADRRKRGSVHPVVVRLKKLRKREGRSQAEFADALGINVFTLRQWEQGRAHPDSTTAAFIKLYLDK